MDRTNLSAQFDLTGEPAQDDDISLDELGFEIRFHWRGAWRRELHRYSLKFRPGNAGTLCDVGEETLPPAYFDET